MAQVTLSSVKKVYAGGVEAVKGVSFDIPDGGFCVLVGPSGCGKSTLLRMVAGLETISSGEVSISGRVVNQIEPADRDIAMVFQNYALYPHMSVYDNMAYGLRNRGTPKDEIEKRVKEAARILAIEGLLERRPRQLSGGQRQRVAIARALILNPEMVVCDEPTSALDVSVQSQILNLLNDLRRELGLTYVFISHNLVVVEHIATRVAVMYLGRVVELTDTATLFKAPRHPYTKALLASVLTPEPGKGIPETGLGLAFPDPLNPPPGCPFHPRCPAKMTQCATLTPKLRQDESGLVACHLYESATSGATAS